MVSQQIRPRRRADAFTLIEMLVVLSIIALLISIAVPRYFLGVQRARESSLRTSLNVMRDAIDKFAADQGRYPSDLGELVDHRYLKVVPKDPITGHSDWSVMPPSDDSFYQGGVMDVKTQAQGTGSDGTDYANW